jgi:flavoprotein
MPIVLFLGRNVKEYTEKSEKTIKEMIKENAFRCEICLQPMKLHSSYERGIKETGEKLTIMIVRCKACEKGHALLPDFLLPNKHYSGNEIESVIIDGASVSVDEIETEASESTVRRWISEVGESVQRACGIIKYLFKRMGRAISELSVTAGPAYSELEEILEMAPERIKNSGNKLGLANLWIGRNEIRAYI